MQGQLLARDQLLQLDVPFALLEVMLLLVRHRARPVLLARFHHPQVNPRALDPTLAALVRRQLRVHHQPLLDVQIVKLVHFKVLRVTSKQRALLAV